MVVLMIGIAWAGSEQVEALFVTSSVSLAQAAQGRAFFQTFGRWRAKREPYEARTRHQGSKESSHVFDPSIHMPASHHRSSQPGL